MRQPKTLYHLTWTDNIASILDTGLRPNYRPNRWATSGAPKRSVGKLFLCNRSRKTFWFYVYADGYVYPPSNDSSLVWITVNVSGIDLTPDESPGENYRGDYWTNQSITPDRIRVGRNRY